MFTGFGDFVLDWFYGGGLVCLFVGWLVLLLLVLFGLWRVLVGCFRLLCFACLFVVVLVVW